MIWKQGSPKESSEQWAKVYEWLVIGRIKYKFKN